MSLSQALNQFAQNLGRYLESILEYSITYPEVKKHCSLRHMQTDSRVKRRLVYWHYPMLNLLKIRTVNQS